jgi:hypothetical protein
MKKLTSILCVVFLLIAVDSFAQKTWKDMYLEDCTVQGTLKQFSLKIATIAMTGVDYTLSAAEALCNILIVTGSPSSASIIAPTLTKTDTGLLYTVRNAGSDSGKVNIKATGKTGIDVAAGKTAEVYWLTDDYVRKTADATH